MSPFCMKKLQKQTRYQMYPKNMKMDHGNEKHTKKKNLKLRYDLLRNKYEHLRKQHIHH